MNKKLSGYIRFCPNCGNIIYDDRLKKGLVCFNCLKKVYNSINTTKTEDFPEWFYLFDKIKEGNLKQYKKFFDMFLDFREFFYKITNKYPWSLQNNWTKRVFLKESFSIIAATGVGKTTWGLVMGLYLYLKPIFKNKGKIYYIFPTSLLVQHSYEKFKNYLEKFCKIFGKNKDIYNEIIVYYGDLSNKQKKDIKQRIKEENFKILFTTTNFLYKNFDIFKNNINKFEFIFVDDVDSLLKTARNIDYILSLMGFSDKSIKLALQTVKIKTQLPLLKGKNLEESLGKLQDLKNELDKLKSEIDTILVTSSATAKPKGLKIKILGELLNFEVGNVNTNLRNIEDIYIETEDIESYLKKFDFGKFLELYENKFIQLLNILKNGIFCFIPSDWGKEEIFKVKEYLLTTGFYCEVYEKINDEVIEQFRQGKVKILIGIASWRNPLARGIDLPDVSKYVLFLGVPKFIFNANMTYNPRGLISIILNLQKILPNDIKKNIEFEEKNSRYLKFLKKISNYTKEYILQNPFLKEKLEETYGFVNELINQKEITKLLVESQDISFDGQSFIIADIAAYLQASGRVSRMYVGGLTKGLSIVFVDNKKAFNNLQKRIKWFYDDLKFKKLEI